MQVKLSKKGIVLWFKNKMRKDPALLAETYPSSPEQVEHMLNKADTWKICAGGPCIDQSPSIGNIKLKKYVKDDDRWRHTDCEVFVENGHVCKKCVSTVTRLQEIVANWNQKARNAFPKAVECADLRQRVENKRERLDINVTPRSKNNFKKYKNKLKSTTDRLTRKEQKVYLLESKIRDISNKDDKCIDDFLKSKKIPDQQVRIRTAILHETNEYL